MGQRQVVGDSQLILSQQRSNRPSTTADLAERSAQARRLADSLRIRRWTHHPREFNKMADAAANAAMDSRASSQTRHPTDREDHRRTASPPGGRHSTLANSHYLTAQRAQSPAIGICKSIPVDLTLSSSSSLSSWMGQRRNVVTPFMFDLLTYDSTFGLSDDLGWRVTLLFPALLMVCIGVLLYSFSDDCPHDNFADLRKKQKALNSVNQESADASAPANPAQSKPSTANVHVALRAVSKLPVTLILVFQYACSFGVELQVHNVLSLYYYEARTPLADPHKCRILIQTTASLISSLFGLMCIFARAMCGVASDFASHKIAMRGHIVAQFLAFASQAITLYVYSQVRSVYWSTSCLILFGMFLQACTGTTFAIVPYVSPHHTGASSDIVGAGGNGAAGASYSKASKP